MLLIIGLISVGIALMFSFIELTQFFRMWGKLNKYTRNQKGAVNIAYAYAKYPWRWITEVLPKATPLAIDAAIVAICGAIGMNGGVTAATIALVASSIASILARVYRWTTPKQKELTISTMTWEEFAALKH